jgi:hypothetical protein
MIILEAIDLCQADQGSIILFDPDQEQLTKTLIRSADPETSRIDTHLNNLLAGWVYEHGKHFITSDIALLFGDRPVKPKYRSISSVLSMPLKK